MVGVKQRGGGLVYVGVDRGIVKVGASVWVVGSFHSVRRLQTLLSAMAARRVSWLRALEVRHEDALSGIRYENNENANPMLGGALETTVQERLVFVRCQPRGQPRRQPRIPLRDITHLFLGNVASLDDKTDLSPLILQAQGNGPVRRLFASASSQTSRKRRHAEPSSKTTSVRRVLPKFR